MRGEVTLIRIADAPCAFVREQAAALEHDPEKWAPIFRKDHAQTKR
jgi:hypothetical protein